MAILEFLAAAAGAGVVASGQFVLPDGLGPLIRRRACVVARCGFLSLVHHLVAFAFLEALAVLLGGCFGETAWTGLGCGLLRLLRGLFGLVKFAA